jgi:predicted anti-sigma-YlaC factor YlaD
MKCHTIEEKLSAYQDGELSVSEKEQVERHLAGCHSCREQHVTLQQTLQSLGDLQEIPTPAGFYGHVTQKINHSHRQGLIGALYWVNWGFKALPSTVITSIILAIGILSGTYVGNSLAKFQPFHRPIAFSEESLLSSLKMFEPVPPGTLSDGYERLMSSVQLHIENESHTK